jgi:hypothetical protein
VYGVLYRDVHVGFVGVLLGAADAPLAQLVAVVGTEEDEGVLQYVLRREVVQNQSHHVVYPRDCAPPVAKVHVNPFLGLGVEWWVLGNMMRLISLPYAGIVSRCPWGAKVGKPISGPRRRVGGVVWRVWSKVREEGLVKREGSVDKLKRAVPNLSGLIPSPRMM